MSSEIVTTIAKLSTLMRADILSQKLLNMAKISWGFNITSSPDSSAKVDASVSTGYSDGFVFSPKKFPAWFTPRSDKHREVIMREFEMAKATFALYEEPS